MRFAISSAYPLKNQKIPRQVFPLIEAQFRLFSIGRQLESVNIGVSTNA